MRRRLLFTLLALCPIAAWAADTTKAQPELPKERLTIVVRDGAEHVFNVEMALTPAQQEVGEMFRPGVPPDGGMLFDWGIPRESSMWMRNTIASLDMIFINADGTMNEFVLILKKNCELFILKNRITPTDCSQWTKK